MKALKERLSKIERRVYSKYNHYGLFIIFVKDGIYKINNINEDISFISMQKLEDYIFNKFQCERYNFITIDFDVLGHRYNEKEKYFLCTSIKEN